MEGNRQIEIRSNRDAQPRAYIVGTRIRVQDIFSLSERQGKTPDEIAAAFPHLTLAQIHAALAYYFDHQEEIQSEIREDEAFATAMKAKIGPGPLAKKRKGAKAVRDSV